jgi:hypothetical protein
MMGVLNMQNDIDPSKVVWDKEVIDPSKIQWDGDKSQPQGKSVGGFLLNAAEEVPEMAKGVWETGKLVSELWRGNPKPVVDVVKNLPSALADTAIDIRDAVRDKGVLGAVGDYVYEKPLTTAMTVVPGIGAAGKVAKTVGLTKTGAALEKMGTLGIAGRTPKPVDIQLNNIIDRGISKGIRPSVEGKRTFTQASKYNDRAREAVKTIISNKNNLQLVDETGQLTAKLPETLQQFSQAIDQTKRAIFHDYDEIVNATGKIGAKADLKPIVSELRNIVDDEVVNTVKPEISNYARTRMEAFERKGEFTPTQAQDAISHLNQSLEAFYKNPTYENASKASIDSMIANRLRKQLDDAIEGLEGSGYQQLKNKYGSLKAIERDVNRRAIVDARKNMKGLIDFSDIFSGSEVVRGILSMNPSTIASGMTAKAIASIYRHMNNPNTIVKNMFSNVDKIMSKANMGASPIVAPKQKALPPGNPQEGSFVSGGRTVTIDKTGKVRTGDYGRYVDEINSPYMAGTQQRNYPNMTSPFLPAVQKAQPLAVIPKKGRTPSEILRHMRMRTLGNIRDRELPRGVSLYQESEYPIRSPKSKSSKVIVKGKRKSLYDYK